MKTRNEIRDVSGNIIGRIDYSERRYKAQDVAGNSLGYYDPFSNETRDIAGNILSRNGNILTSLFFKK